MKKQSEKQPIDDLFARKLGNMSLPPSANGFEQLQARMGQGQPEARIVFWRNPSIQRYMAAAACLLLVCLFGWLYWPAGTKTISGETQVATNQNAHSPQKKSIKEQKTPTQTQPAPDIETPVEANPQKGEEQLAKAEKTQVNSQAHSQSGDLHKPALQSVMPVHNEPVIAQTKPIETQNQHKSEVIPTNVTPINQSASEQVADNKPATKPAPAAERVLVVTIEEPASLVAARQAISKNTVEEKPAIAVNEKPEKESKVSGLWQQVKRFKQGEVFARHDNPTDEDRGLLGRAYSGLKHSLDKDKSIKQ